MTLEIQSEVEDYYYRHMVWRFERRPSDQKRTHTRCAVDGYYYIHTRSEVERADYTDEARP